MPKTKTCFRCGHVWTPRIKDVVQCPKCKSARFNKPLIQVAEEMTDKLLRR